MSKEGKYTLYFIGFLCILVCVAGLSGCKSKGYQGLIYHEKDLIAKTACVDELFFTISTDTIEVRSVYNSCSNYIDKEVYKYKNDGKYSVEKRECER